MSEKRPVGRPRKRPEDGFRRNYTFRMSDRTRDEVFAAAAASQRSMSEEIERRVESASFTDDLRTLIREEIRAALSERQSAEPGRNRDVSTMDAVGSRQRGAVHSGSSNWIV